MGPKPRLILEEPNRVFQSGEDVRGHVTLEVAEPFRGAVSVAWVLCIEPVVGESRDEQARPAPHGRLGATGESGTASVVVDEEDGGAFSIPAPDFPPTYRGEVFARTWQLVVRAQDASGGEEEDRQEVTVELPEDGGIAVRLREPGDPARVGQISKKPLAVTGVVALLCWALAAAGYASGISHLMWLGVIVGSVLLLGTVAALESFVRKSRVGNPQVGVEPAAAGGYREAGGREAGYSCTVWVPPRAKVDDVTVTLEVVEESMHLGGHGTARIEWRKLWSEDATLEPREAGAFWGPLPLPEPRSVPFSVEGDLVRVVWRLIMAVTFAGGHRHTTVTALESRPAQGPGAWPS